MNKNFIDRATSIKRLNFIPHDFLDKKYKKEIQYLIQMHHIPNFDIEKIGKGMDMGRINKHIQEIKNLNFQSFLDLYTYRHVGFGPGEVLMYFLDSDAVLGGGGSAGVDIKTSGNNYEVKAARISRNRVASGIRLGSTVPVSNIINDLYALNNKLKLGGTRTAMPKVSVIDKMREKAPTEFNAIESRYKDAVFKYFSDHKTIFINNNGGSRDIGRIESISRVKRDDISIERVSGNDIPPLIQL